MPEDECLALLPEASVRVDTGGAVVACNGLAEALLGPHAEVGASLLTGVNGFVQWLAGMDDYLPKPLERAALAGVLARYAPTPGELAAVTRQ